MPVVKAQTLFAADAPQHAPAQRQWRRAAEIRGEELANGQTGGRGVAEAQMLRAWGSRCRGSVGRGARRRAARRGCVCVLVRPRQGKRRHTCWCLLLSTAVPVLQNLGTEKLVVLPRIFRCILWLKCLASGTPAISSSHLVRCIYPYHENSAALSRQSFGLRDPTAAISF